MSQSLSFHVNQTHGDLPPDYMGASCYCLKSYIDKKTDIKIGQNNSLKMMLNGTRNATLLENRI